MYVRSVCTVLAISLLSLASIAEEGIPVRVNKRVELLSIVFRLAGAEEYNQQSSQSPYSDAVEKHFGPFREHEVVKFAKQLRQTEGMGFDGVMSFAAHLKESKLEPKMPFRDKPAKFDDRWSVENAERFLLALRKFNRDSKADAFFGGQQKYYERASARLSEELTRRPYRKWLDSFFGGRPTAKFSAIVGLLNGGGNYGMSVTYRDGSEEVMPIIGVYRFDKEGLPVFDKETSATIVHEFCHTYTNTLVDKFIGQLLPAAEKIHPHRKTLLARQAYGTPRTMLYESMVRACTVRFAFDNETEHDAQRTLDFELARGFTWTKDLSALFGTYQQNRRKYPTLEAFMPEVVAFFNRTGGSIEQVMASLPKIVSITPQNGAKDVDPSLTEIRITFDRPMRTDKYSISGGDKVPTSVGKLTFTDDSKTCIWRVKLEPGKTYEFRVNEIYLPGFRSLDGMLLDPVSVTFTTATQSPQKWVFGPSRVRGDLLDTSKEQSSAPLKSS